MTLVKYYIDDNGKQLTVAQTAKIVGLTKEVVRDYVRRIGLTTMEEIIQRRDEPKIKRPVITAKKFQTLLGFLSIPEIKLIHPFKDELSQQTIRGRLSRRDTMCPSLLWEKMPRYDFRKRLVEEGLEDELRKPVQNPAIPTFVFSQRTTHCFEDHQPCKHYSDCSEYREKYGRHNGRLFKSTGCFTPEDFTAWSGGDRTNNHDCNESRCLHSG